MMSAFMFPIYLATNKIQKTQHRERRYRRHNCKQRSLVPREAHAVSPDRPEREAKLTHGNLQISKCLCIIIRSCKIYKG